MVCSPLKTCWYTEAHLIWNFFHMYLHRKSLDCDKAETAKHMNKMSQTFFPSEYEEIDEDAYLKLIGNKYTSLHFCLKEGISAKLEIDVSKLTDIFEVKIYTFLFYFLHFTFLYIFGCFFPQFIRNLPLDCLSYLQLAMLHVDILTAFALVKMPLTYKSSKGKEDELYKQALPLLFDVAHHCRSKKSKNFTFENLLIKIYVHDIIFQVCTVKFLFSLFNNKICVYILDLYVLYKPS